VLVFAGTRGFLDVLEVRKIAKFKNAVLRVSSAPGSTAVLNRYTLQRLVVDGGVHYTKAMFDAEMARFVRTLIRVASI
jgi:hypothetical protein